MFFMGVRAALCSVVAHNDVVGAKGFQGHMVVLTGTVGL
jgi:hypothetical protein